ncbi:ATP-binding cassette domain-containing protein [Mucilaginibacter robiniae]|uniref:ATP-binding cassette domain-containing protein n=1 Tax=Mucilaginibacter robiniae TaxID=2728022 RepID=A0A7L5E7X9_9SPHI|nr:ATP-binding cassette domain-containing protein [Mucilaginibacter robiniae]QJD97944.1 ATP-binding cassette domain-containing protein [Mucilaginibacter robiniae]
MTLLSIHNATVKQANKIILHQINFTVHKGEQWLITGESGSGKTALLQVLAGRLSLSSGNLNWQFNPSNATTTSHRPIALVDTKHHFRTKSNTSEFYYQQRFNSSDTENVATVEEYLTSLPVFNSGTIIWTYDEIIRRLQLEYLLNKPLIQLSNGETRRLLIAAALLKKPEILLMDNPLNGLDVQTRGAFSTLIDEIVASGITVIMSASTQEIPASITHIAYLKQGTIDKISTPEQFTRVTEPADNTPAINKETLQKLLSNNTQDFNDIVNLKNVTVTYNQLKILDSVNWQIKPAEHWALLGPNGAGKSTLLSLINGDNPQAYANDITLFDRKRGSGESIWDIKRKTGFVSPELYQYFPTDSSCLQVIESGFYDTLGLFRPSQPAKVQLATQWMQVLHINQYSRHLFKNIPASTQRLCLLARALIKSPPLLILDEPCQGMDEQQRMNFKSILDVICSLTSAALIYVTHYQQDIPDSVNKVLRLNKGKVVTDE